MAINQRGKATEEHSKLKIVFKVLYKKSFLKLTFQWHLKGKVQRDLNSLKALNSREMGPDPRDELIEHNLYLEKCLTARNMRFLAF